ncbi:MAG: Hint domain-containing protein [Planctomycetaceae bacterium]
MTAHDLAFARLDQFTPRTSRPRLLEDNVDTTHDADVDAVWSRVDQVGLPSARVSLPAGEVGQRPGEGVVASVRSSRPDVTNSPRAGRFPRVKSLATILCFLLAGCCFWNFGSSITSHRHADEAQATVAMPVASHPSRQSIIPISQIEVADKVRGHNPLREQVSDVDVNPATWRKIRLRMAKSQSLLLWIDLLRPIEWIEHHAVVVGETIHLDLVEMGAVGEAEVLAIEPCPPTQPGLGTVVIGKFVHECRDAELVEIRIEGQSESVRVTPEHPYWSEDREEFVPVGELREGERVSTTKGQQRIASLSRTTYTGLLYNLETTEHVFRVGTHGALVHNMCGVGGLDDFADLNFKGQKALGRRLGIDEIDNFPDLNLHKNRLDTPGPHTVYAVRDSNGRILKFGETGDLPTRSKNHTRWFKNNEGINEPPSKPLKDSE